VADSVSPTVSILMVSFNTAEMTLEAIRSVFRETETPFELIVLDNASNDGSADRIQEEFGELVTLVRSDENHGFAQGNNLAARHAQGKYLLLLNPDTVVLDKAIDRLVEFARHEQDARIWGGRTVFGDGSLNPQSCFSAQSLRSLTLQVLGLSSLFRNSEFLNPEGLGGWDRSSERAVDIVSGCFFLIEREFWNQLGGFESEFFMYGEEADLCLRAQRDFGAQPMITPSATIVHYGGAAEATQEGKLVKLIAAKTLLIKRHFEPPRVSAGVTLLKLWPLSRWLAHETLSTLGRSESRDRARVWRAVWQRRSEWTWRGHFNSSAGS
jgi:GT2 family glycosyltransferase